jgi:hypothetical protein
MSSRFSLALALGSLAWPVAPAAPQAAAAPPALQVHLTLAEALALCFPGASIERGTVYLDEDQRTRAQALARETIEGAVVHPYRALRDGVCVGTAWVDVHRVRSLRETVLVAVGPDQRVLRVELLAFGEPEEYVPRGSWYGQFEGRRLDDELDLRRGIRGITGATLTARATTAAVRRVLALQRVIDGPPPPSGSADER